MKIGLFTDCYLPQINGVVTSVLMLEEELVRLGHEVTIITVDVPGYLDERTNIIRIKSIPFHRWKEFRVGIPISAHKLSQIKALHFDLIHTHTEFSIGLLGRHLAKTLDIPTVHTYHTMYEDYTHYVNRLKYGHNMLKKFIKKGSKFYVKSYDGVIAPSAKTRNALIDYGVRNNIFVMPTGIDLSHFIHINQNTPELDALRQKYGLTKDHHILLSVGRLSEEKSHDMLIRQLPKLLVEDPSIRIMFVGDGPYRSKLEKLCQKLNIAEFVIFAGKIPFDHIHLYYNLATLFISCSKTETQGLTIIEAMACNVPVIVYDDTHVKDIVLHKKTGYLFTTEDELFENIQHSLSNPVIRKLLTQNAQIIIRSISKENYGKNAEKIYTHIISGPKSELT